MKIRLNLEEAVAIITSQMKKMYKTQNVVFNGLDNSSGQYSLDFEVIGEAFREEQDFQLPEQLIKRLKVAQSDNTPDFSPSMAEGVPLA